MSLIVRGGLYPYHLFIIEIVRERRGYIHIQNRRSQGGGGGWLHRYNIFRIGVVRGLVLGLVVDEMSKGGAF